MKKIQLTENELKRMIINVMEQMNTPSNENDPELFADHYDYLLLSHLEDIYTSFDKIKKLSDDIDRDKNLNSRDKKRLTKNYDYVFKHLYASIALLSDEFTLKK